MSPSSAVPLSLRLRPPVTIGAFASRNRLIEAVRERLKRNIVLVQAPAGFGKTYLLADAFRQLGEAGMPVGWLALAGPYGDENAFLVELAAACGVPSAAETGDIEERLCRELGARPASTVLMLDDCDGAIDAAVSSVLDRLVAHVPDKLRIILACRFPPASPTLSTLLLRGGLAQIEWHDLRFTATETTALLPAGIGEHLGEKIAGFAAGWPAILRLACIALEGDRNRAGAQDLFDGSFAPLVRYIRDCALAGLDPIAREACRLSGFLDAVSVELVGALSPELAEQANGHGAIDELEPLIARVRERSGWYHIHPAIAAVFRYEFACLPRAMRASRHTDAAHWFADNGLLEEAVHHAVETGDFRLAERAIQEAGGVRIFLRSGFPTLHRLLSELPSHVILGSSALQLCQAVVFGKHGQLASARELVEDVKRALRAGDGNVDVLPEDLAQIDSLISIYEDTVGHPEMVAQLERDARSLPPRELWRIAWAANHLSIGYTVMGDFEKAEIEALRALTCYREADIRYAQVFMLTHLGLIAVSRGKPASALDSLKEAELLIDRNLRGDPHLKAIVSVPLAEIHAAHGEIDRACALLDEAIPRLQAGEAWVDLFVRAYITRIRIATFRNETRLALRLVDMAEQVAHQRNLPRLRVLAGLIRLDVMTRTGLTEAAEEIAPSIHWLIDEGQTASGSARHTAVQPTWRERHLALQLMARIHWSRGQQARAIELLDRLSQSAKQTGAGLDLATARAMQFCYLWHMKRPDDARESFQLAVALATPQRLVGIFVDESYPMAVAIRGILRHFGASAFSHATIEFTNAILGAQVSATDAQRTGRIEILLTDHEQEILEHLARGLSNKTIARAIGRTEATVKYHLRRIYAKLGVKSRGMAVVMARKASIVV